MLPKCRAIYIKFTVLLCLHPNTLFFIIELARYLVLPGVFRGFSVVFLSRSRFLPRLLSRSRSLSLPACLPLPLPVTAPEKLNSTVFVNHICTHLPKATNTSKHHTCPLCQIWHRSFNTKGPRFKDTFASSNQQVCRRHGCNIQQFYSSHTVNKTTGQEITSRS